MKPNMTFQERAKLGMELLSKQKPVTLQEARAQCLRVKAWSTSNKNKTEEIKHLLRIYYPDWTNEQIEKEFERVMIDAESFSKKNKK